MRQRITVLLLMVMAALVGALVMPAIHRFREFQNRTAGLCRFQQIGLALQNHNDACGSFPYAALPHPELVPEKRLSWMVAILPYIEQDDLYRRIDKDKAWDDPDNREAVDTVIITYLCSANPNQPQPGMPGPTHYVGIAGVGQGSAHLPADHPKVGVFGYDRCIRIPEGFKDGSTNTIVLIDTSTMNGPWAAGGPSTIREVFPGIHPYIGPNRQFGGAYRGYARIGLGDGSARSILDSISPTTFENACTIADGQVLAADW